MNVQAASNSSAAAVCRNGPLLRKMSVVSGRTKRILLVPFPSYFHVLWRTVPPPKLRGNSVKPHPWAKKTKTQSEYSSCYPTGCTGNSFLGRKRPSDRLPTSHCLPRVFIASVSKQIKDIWNNVLTLNQLIPTAITGWGSTSNRAGRELFARDGCKTHPMIKLIRLSSLAWVLLKTAASSLNAALSALGSKGRSGRGRHILTAVRARIAAAQRARWSKARGGKTFSIYYRTT